MGAEGGNDFPRRQHLQQARSAFTWKRSPSRAKGYPSGDSVLQRVADSSAPIALSRLCTAHLAEIRFSRGSFEEAIQSWKDIQATHRKEWPLTRFSNRLYSRRCANAESQRVLNGAVEFLRELLKLIGRCQLSPTLEDAWTMPAENFSINRTINRRLSSLRRRSKKAAQTRRGNGLGPAYKQQGLLSKARRVLQDVVQSDSGIAFSRASVPGRKTDASGEQDFARCGLKKPNYFEAGYNLVMTRLSLGEVDRAKTLLQQVIELTRSNRNEILTLLTGSSETAPRRIGKRGWSNSCHISPEEEPTNPEFSRDLGHPPPRPDAERFANSSLIMPLSPELI